MCSTGETPSPGTGMLPYHQFGRVKIFSAFSRLSEAIEDCKGIEIQLMNDFTYSSGAYAWLKCASGIQCADKLKELAGIEGTPGVNFGSTNDCKFTTLLAMLPLSTKFCVCIVTPGLRNGLINFQFSPVNSLILPLYSIKI